MRTLLGFTLMICVRLASAQANYSKTAEIPPLRVSFTALQNVLDKTQKLISSANSGAASRSEEVVLKAGTVQITIPGRTLAPLNAKVPEQIDSITYSYLSRDGAPVSRVNFDFSDFRRTFTVVGSSPEQVDAIFAATREDLLGISSSIGGTGIKTLLGIPAYGLLLTMIGWWGAAWYSYRSRRNLVKLLTAAAAFLLLLILPTGDLLAGFLAFRGEPSFMIRYAAEISGISLVLAVIGISPSLQQLLTPKKATENTTDRAHNEVQITDSTMNDGGSE